MLGLITKNPKRAFNASILKTFGKLSQRDINEIDGNRDRLIVELIAQYGWKEEVAQQRVELFSASLLTASHSDDFTASEPAGS